MTLVPLAPLTNIALLLRTYPECAHGIARIVFMGGAAHVGNATASAEFNVFHDPEAAAVVLDACAELGVPVTMYGLDVFYEPRVGREARPTSWSVGGRGRRRARRPSWSRSRRAVRRDAATIGDAGAVCAVDRPGRRRGPEPLPVRVELAGTWSRGRTIVDRRDWSGDLAHDPHGAGAGRVDVALEVDGARYARLWARHHRAARAPDGARRGARLAQRRPRHPRRAAPGAGGDAARRGLRRLAGGKGGNQAVAAAAAGAGCAMVGASGATRAAAAY